MYVFLCVLSKSYTTHHTHKKHMTQKNTTHKNTNPSYSHEQIPISTKTTDRVIPVRTHSDEQTDNKMTRKGSIRTTSTEYHALGKSRIVTLKDGCTSLSNQQ